MSKEVEFPVVSMMLTGILFVLGILLATLSILLTVPSLNISATIIAFVQFIGLFLLGWSLLSLSLHPDIDESRKAISFFFVLLLVVVLFHYGLNIAIHIG